jgi:hypothetical protein
MNVQAPTLTTSHRRPLLVGALGLASAAIAAGAIAISNGDDTSAPTVAPVKPAVVQGTPERVWDGAAILRGTESPSGVGAVSKNEAERVWDGSPILRGTSIQHSGGPSMAPFNGASPDMKFRAGRPESFHVAP